LERLTGTRRRGRRRAAPGPRSRPGIAHRALPEGAPGLLDPRFQLTFRLADGLNILLGPCAIGCARSPIQFPRGDDDLLLRRDEIVQLLVALSAAHGGLALGERELLLERLHLEEEDVAARLARAPAARNVPGA